MHNFIRCGRCGDIKWHGDSMPSRELDGCEKCKPAREETTEMQKMTEERLREIEERQKAALQELFGLCDGSRKFTRCIPLQETDTDIVIDASLHDIPDLIQTVREQATLIEELQKVVDAAS